VPDLAPENNQESRADACWAVADGKTISRADARTLDENAKRP
jgi:hypothetical protein